MKKSTKIISVVRIISVLMLCLSYLGCPSNNGPTTGSGLSGTIYYSSGSKMDRIRLSDETVEQLMNDVYQPDVMANGNIVAVESTSGRIIITDLSGANRKSLVEYSAVGVGYQSWLHAPRISYDQKYVGYDGYGYHQVTHIVDAQTGAWQATIGDYQNNAYYAPSWAPDGSLIVQGQPAINNGIYKVDKDFTTITRIDPNLTNVTSPSVSPDGTTIAFLRDGELWTMSINGSNPTQLKTNLYQLRTPTWSPDSKHIAVTSQGAIYVIDPKSVTMTKISSAYSNETQICWK